VRYSAGTAGDATGGLAVQQGLPPSIIMPGNAPTTTEHYTADLRLHLRFTWCNAPLPQLGDS
jgi:hypothetical protein